ncbi:MAG: hypothetical protein PHC51_07995 [bacterium]|nr:hypothetical protein [bacterium]
MHAKTIKLETPGKINLVLDVLGRMSSGYHALRSIYSTISLCDELEVTYQPQSENRVFTIEFDARLQTHLEAVARAAGKAGSELGKKPLTAQLAGADNLVLRALDACLECVHKNTGPGQNSPIRGEFVVRLCKRLPFSAGLGGGSANAAGMIRVFQRLFPGLLTEDDVRGIAAAVGSDVMLFLYPGLGVFWGRGEKVVSLPGADSLAKGSCILIKPAYGSITTEAYANLRADFLTPEQESQLDKALFERDFTDAVRAFSGGFELFESDVAQVSGRLTDSGRQSNRTSASPVLISEVFTATKRANIACEDSAVCAQGFEPEGWSKWLRNSFAAGIVSDGQSEEASMIAGELRRCGAEGVVLCGSGSCWAGLSQGKLVADEQLMALAQQHGWFVCHVQLGYCG